MVGPIARRSIIRCRTAAMLLVAALLTAGCSSSSNSSSPPPPPPPPPPPAVPAVSVAAATLTEGDSGTAAMEFSVTMSASSATTVSVDYATADGTATAPSDYEAASGTLDFPAGTTSQTISVTINGDGDVEASETFTVSLSNPDNASIAQGSATGTIINDDATTGVFGLDVRPDNQTCVAPPRPTADASVSIVVAWPGLPSVSQPTKMLLEPGTDPRWFVLQKSGEVVTFDPDNATSVDTYIDLNDTRNINTASEGGLLGMAFHPDYPNTPEIFLSFTIDHSGPSMRSVISRFILDDVDNPGGGTEEQVIIEIDQDFNNHNGGDIAFGPDGLPVLRSGRRWRRQRPARPARAGYDLRLLGSMLRIDVLGTGVSFPGNPYDIPDGQSVRRRMPKCGPGANTERLPGNLRMGPEESHGDGVSTPTRVSCGSADVGQGAYEEVDLIELGGNYGWRCREGDARLRSDAGDCAGVGSLIDPITEYNRTARVTSITGGYVYRGTRRSPNSPAVYIFCRLRIRTLLGRCGQTAREATTTTS